MTDEMADEIEETEKPYLSLTKEARWAKVVETIMGNPKNVTITALAEKLGVSRGTIYKDLDDPKFATFKDQLIIEIVNSNLLLHAWKNVTNEIVVEKNIAVSKWLIENYHLMNLPPGDSGRYAPFNSSEGEEKLSIAEQRKYIQSANLMRQMSQDGNGKQN